MLLSIIIVRVLVILTDRAWLADLILGALFVIVGFVLLRLRRAAVQEVEAIVSNHHHVLIIGSGPGRPHRRHLRGPGQPRAARHRGRAVVDHRTSPAGSSC